MAVSKERYIARRDEVRLAQALQRSPATAILGPRQCGKSTLAREFLRGKDAVFLDLQNRTDRNKLNEPELFFDEYRSQLICLDEIQQIPEFFSVLRSEIDKDRRAGRFLLLGSASRDLLRQSNETLAGRISLLELTPFLYQEIQAIKSQRDHWLRGGFPQSLLAADDANSFAWREDFISTFLERDIPALGFSIPAPVFARLWRILAHYHGQTLNYSKVAQAAGLAVKTLKQYLYILQQTYMIRLLAPMENNLKKRLIKSPKLYLRDSGIAHNLLDIDTYADLLGSPYIGASWEGYSIENVLSLFPRWRPSYVRTANGAEVDLVLERAGKRLFFEFKASKSPTASRGFYQLLQAFKPDFCWLVAPVEDSYPYSEAIRVANVHHLQQWCAQH
ncbi:MAG: AAA family ATPase [Gammaproteobacteria bacterium]|nr:AAA family ATPase [Gammaproteobacteria bacterium]